MEDTVDPVIQDCLAFWQPRTPRPLSHEDARQISENIEGFFDTLVSWRSPRLQKSTAGARDAHASRS
jgi:hypothetical protein